MHDTTRYFSCISDAAAHYYRLGYLTALEYDQQRFMTRDDDVVRIEKTGFLVVEATEFKH